MFIVEPVSFSQMKAGIGQVHIRACFRIAFSVPVAISFEPWSGKMIKSFRSG